MSFLHAYSASSGFMALIIKKAANVILLIAIHPQEQLLFNEAFHKITEILCDDENISRIMHCRNLMNL